MRAVPMPGWPSPSEAQIAAAERVLRSTRINYWTGEEGLLLEREYAAALGRAHAVAVANGTVALELALRAFEIGAGDDVVVPARTFIATASAVVAVGATPVVADIDPDSGNLTAETVAEALTDGTRAVIPVHLGGWPVEMDPLLELARDRGLTVIEDCAQAHGARYRGRTVGSIGDAGCFSFCQDKVISAGEGGLVAFDDQGAYASAWEYKDHGKSLVRLGTDNDGAPGSFRWIHDSFGSNFRLPELEAALTRVGLAELPTAHTRRSTFARRLAAGLRDVSGIRVPLPPAYSEHAFYRLYAFVEPDALGPGWDRDRVLAAILAEGVSAQYGSCAEIYREQAFASAGLARPDRLPGAARAHDTSLAFFVHPTLSELDIDDTVAAVRKVMEAATS